ncbi:MAG: MBL fold metallo-hydrolase [Leptospira sp.]|nr:MBL fold metallo-hydrolase [Leptospira sp.]
MKVNLHGVRGSLPAPLRNNEYKTKVAEILRLFTHSTHKNSGNLKDFWKSLPNHLKYTVGGDTTCVSVESRQGACYVVDFGTGSRVLGDGLVPAILSSNQLFELNVFITHTHWDHIQALPFFKPIFFPQVKIRFHSPYPDLEERLIYQMKKEFFPIEFHDTSSQKEFILFQPGETLEFEEGRMKIEVHPLKHPGNSYAYKFIENEKIFIFATDAEFTGDDWEYIRGVTPFFTGSDLLVIDSQYTLDESFAKFDWGHTAYTMAVNIANHWKIKNLALTHHEPSYDDKKVYGIWEESQEHAKALGDSKLKIHLAREGMVFKL